MSLCTPAAAADLYGALPRWRIDARRSMILGDDRTAGGARAGGRQKIERRLAAILGADIMGYSTLMGQAEEETHRRAGAEINRVAREIEKSHGRVFALTGDGLMAEFPSAVEALKCALRIQADAGKRNARLEPDRQILFRIGINSGEIVLQKDRMGGNAVNVAARLEALAEPGGVSLSGAVFEQVRRTVAACYDPVGEQRLKNIRDPVMVYTIRASACSSWISMPALPRQIPAVAGGTTEAGGEYRASLAVLPFRTLQKDQADAYFAEGMIDDIIRALGGLNDLLVV
jgi:adenylate cyclase